MKIIFTKISPTHHSLELLRDDGSCEYTEIETKTFMPHDLIHYAFESEAGLQNSFWGLLDKDKTLAELNDKQFLTDLIQSNSEIAQTEMITGILHGLAKGEATVEQTMAGVENAFSAKSIPVPDYLTRDFLTKLKERFRQLLGKWSAMKKGEKMELEF